jgi:hypothetical protein
MAANIMGGRCAQHVTALSARTFLLDAAAFSKRPIGLFNSRSTSTCPPLVNPNS